MSSEQHTLENEQPLNIPKAGGTSTFLSGDYVKANDIKKVRITGLAEMVSFDDPKAADGKKHRVQLPIECDKSTETSPTKWTMNATSARALEKYFGSALPSKWLGDGNNWIPIESQKPSNPQMNRSVMVDEDVLYAKTAGEAATGKCTKDDECFNAGVGAESGLCLSCGKPREKKA